MARKVDVHNLVTASEIAERLGVADVNVVHNWRRRHAATFPAPVIDRPKVILWDWSDVQTWATTYGFPKPPPNRR